MAALKRGRQSTKCRLFLLFGSQILNELYTTHLTNSHVAKPATLDFTTYKGEKVGCHELIRIVPGLGMNDGKYTFVGAT